MTQTRLEAFQVRDNRWQSMRDTVTTPTSPSPSVGLLISAVEVDMWKDRKDDGPFAVAEDFSTNSPGHWTEMNATMSLDFTTARWSGPQYLGSDGRILKWTDGLESGLENNPPSATRLMTSDMMSAAYAAYITGNTTVAENVVTELVYYATRDRLDYGNRTLWPYDYYNDGSPLFMHAVWVTDFVVAYGACKALGVVTGTQQATIEGWFLDLADLCEQILQNNLGKRFPNRRSDSYASRDVLVDNEMYSAMRNSSGTALYHPRIMLFYNNRRNYQASLVGLVGALTGNQFFIDEYKRYAREWVMFGNSLEGGSRYHFGDVDRGRNSLPQLGLSYHTNSTARLLLPADELARQGDTEVYEFSSSEGSAHPTYGTNHFKTMEQCLNVTIGWIKRSWGAYYTADSPYADPPPTSIVGDPFYQVTSRASDTGRELVADAGYLLAANYYVRDDWQDTILRVGTPTGFTSTPWQAGKITGWRADRRQRFLRSLDANPHGGA